MNTRILAIVIFTIVALFLVTIMQRIARKMRGEETVQENQLTQQLKKRKQKQKERQDELKEDPMNLSGEKVLLRPVNILDKKPLSVILNDKRVALPIGMEPIKRVSQMEKIVRDEYLGTLGIYSIVALSSMKVVGLAKLLYDETDEDTMDIILFISRQYWRHGLGRDAAKTLIDFAIQERDCKKLVTRLAETDEKNECFLEDLGFTQEEERTFAYYPDN